MNITIATAFRSRLARSARRTLGLRIVGYALQFLSGVLLARFLGPEGYGVFAFPISVITLLALPATLGLPQLVTRLVSKYHARNENGILRGLLTKTTQIGLIGAAVLATVAGASYALFSWNHSTGERITFYVALVMLPFLTLGSLRAAALRGLGKVPSASVPENVVQPGLFIVSFLVLQWGFGLSGRAEMAMVLRLVSTIGAFAVGTILLVHRTAQIPKDEDATYYVRDWLRSAVPFLVLGAGNLINNEMGVVLVGFLRPMADVGLYRTVVRGATLAGFVLTAISTVIGPEISRLWTIGDRKTLQKLITVSTSAMAATTVCIGGALMAGALPILKLVFGPQFVAGVWTLRILCIGQIISALAGAVGPLMNMTGHQKQSALAMLIAASVNVLVTSALLPKFGINGAAIGSVIASIVWNSIMIAFVRKKIGLRTTVLSLIRPHFAEATDL